MQISIENRPKVSVCMITYGHEKYIRQAIEGVLMQECDFEVELIVANDSSPDNTDAVVQDIIKNHPRGSWIKYFNHPENLGMMGNLIFALENCTGKYIAYCEGDDYWTHSQKIKMQVEFLENNLEFKFCLTNADFYYENKKRFVRAVLNTDSKPLHLNIESLLLKKGFMAPCSWLGERECFSYTNLLGLSADATFAIFMDVLQKTKVHFIETVTSVYRLLDESASNSKSFLKMYNYHKGLFEIQMKYIKKYQLHHLEKKVYDSNISTIISLFTHYEIKNVAEILELLRKDFSIEEVLLLQIEIIKSYSEKLKKLNMSTSMQIGKCVTKPVKFLRNKLK